MKTSNKLLIGMFLFVVVGIFAANIIYKKKLDAKMKTVTEIQNPDNTVTINDSIIAPAQ
jgi:hypothetical protein